MTESPSYDLFISYAEADQTWVEGYLLDVFQQAGVRHHSEAAFALGKPRLIEFEQAIQHSRRILLVLSPAYLADNISEFVDLLAQSYGAETNSWPVIPLILHPVKLPLRLVMLTTLNAAEPARWPTAVERLCAELQRPVPGPAPRPPCPYPGMVPFSEADRERFFGRDREVQELVERLRLHPFLTVIGPSGSGKSSLVFAGLIPALRQSGLFGPGEWLVQVVRPGESPLDALTGVLHGDPTDPDKTVSGLLAARPNACQLLLVIDQFEELFTLARSDIEPFHQALLHLTQVPHCYVLLTVRADFYPDLMATSLWREIQAHRMEVLPLDKGGLRQAIVRPAQSVGVFVEDGLVERLLADAVGEPGVLPLVQETLVLLWERLEQRFLPLHAYEALGGPGRTGLQVAMARRADAALADLTPVQQAMARRVFMRLVQFGEGRADTRRQQSVADLRAAGDDPALFDQTLRRLVDCRLLTLAGEEQDADRKTDIAHEALISGWPALQSWLEKRKEAEQTRRRLEAKAVEWERLGRGSGGLLDQVELAEAERWLASPDATDLGYTTALADIAWDSRAALERAQAEKKATHERELEQAQELAKEQSKHAEAQALATERRQRLARLLRAIFVGSLVLSIGLLVTRQGFSAPLHTAAAPFGLVSLEYAGSIAHAQAIIDSWPPAVRNMAVAAVGISILSSLVFAIVRAIGCMWAGKAFRLRHRLAVVARVAFWLSWAQLPTALLDVVANVSLMEMLLNYRPTRSLWPQIASAAATGSFFLVTTTLVYIASGAIVWVGCRCPRISFEALLSDHRRDQSRP